MTTTPTARDLLEAALGEDYHAEAGPMADSLAATLSGARLLAGYQQPTEASNDALRDAILRAQRAEAERDMAEEALGETLRRLRAQSEAILAAVALIPGGAS